MRYEVLVKLPMVERRRCCHVEAATPKQAEAVAREYVEFIYGDPESVEVRGCCPPIGELIGAREER